MPKKTYETPRDSLLARSSSCLPSLDLARQHLLYLARGAPEGPRPARLTPSGFGVWGLGFEVKGVGSWAWGLGFRASGLGCHLLGCDVKEFWFGVEG